MKLWLVVHTGVPLVLQSCRGDRNCHIYWSFFYSVFLSTSAIQAQTQHLSHSVNFFFLHLQFTILHLNIQLKLANDARDSCNNDCHIYWVILFFFVFIIWFPFLSLFCVSLLFFCVCRRSSLHKRQKISKDEKTLSLRAYLYIYIVYIRRSLKNI
jgi:hypothetical protein